MADQSLLSSVCAALLASVLGVIYRKLVPERYHIYVINIFFGGCFVAIVVGLLIAWSQGKVELK